MIAHLYKSPSTFRNIPDRIIIRATEPDSYPGNWLHATIELPEGTRAIDPESTKCGNGAIVLGNGEITQKVYPNGQEKIDGTGATVRIYTNDFTLVTEQKVRWG